MSTLNEQIKSFEKKQFLVSFVVLIIFLASSVIFNFVLINNRAEQTTKLVSRMIQTNDFREVALTLQEARLNYFKKIHYKSTDKRRTFTLPQIAELYSENRIFHLFFYNEIEFSVESMEIGSEKESIVFEYNRYALFPHAFALWILLILFSVPQIRYMKKRLAEQFSKEIALHEEAAYGEVAKKMKHNIRTPLAALMRLSAGLKNLDSEQKDLFQGIISQIKDLISDLDISSDKEYIQTSDSFLATINYSIQESKLTLPAGVQLKTRVEDSLASAKVNFIDHELRSILANLMNNAVEAMNGVGIIDLQVIDNGVEAQIKLTDNGPGIRNDILSRVTEKGFSYGKSQGSGIGLFHATENINRWGGQLGIESQPGSTIVSIRLPIPERQAWYTPRIKIGSNDKVIVVDDQVSIHRLWQLRLNELGFKGSVKYFYNFEETKNYMMSAESNLDCEYHFFIDYDLGPSSKENGIDFLKSLDIEKKRYLVTGHFDEKSIQYECAESNILLIPKTELAAITMIID